MEQEKLASNRLANNRIEANNRILDNYFPESSQNTLNSAKGHEVLKSFLSQVGAEDDSVKYLIDANKQTLSETISPFLSRRDGVDLLSVNKSVNEKVMIDLPSYQQNARLKELYAKSREVSSVSPLRVVEQQNLAFASANPDESTILANPNESTISSTPLRAGIKRSGSYSSVESEKRYKTDRSSPYLG